MGEPVVEEYDPAGLQVDLVGNDVQKTWDASPTAGVTEYAIHRRSPSTGEPFDPEDNTTEIARVSNTEYTDIDPGGGDYDYQVFGVIE